jgi:hypothetical protein
VQQLLKVDAEVTALEEKAAWNLFPLERYSSRSDHAYFTGLVFHGRVLAMSGSLSLVNTGSR